MHRSTTASTAAFALSAALVALLPAAPIGAQILPGSQLTFAGTATATDLGTPGVLLDFLGPVRASQTGNTGSFASLNQSTAVAGPIRNFTVGNGPQPISRFLVLGGYRFDLVAMPGGAYGQDACYVAPVAGQTCTPYQSPLGNPRTTDPLSPFYLANVETGDPAMPIASVVAFDLFGTVTGPGGVRSNFFGTIATVLPGSYQEVLGGLEQAGAAGQGLSGVPFTGTFVAGGTFAPDVLAPAVVPEPSTYALMAVGLGGVGALARRRRRVPTA